MEKPTERGILCPFLVLRKRRNGSICEKNGAFRRFWRDNRRFSHLTPIGLEFCGILNYFLETYCIFDAYLLQ